MFKDGKYRFSLGFGCSEKERRVGEFLERLGNRKSSLIVDVLNEYIDNHPELENSHGKIQVKISTPTPAYSREKIEQIVRELVSEMIANTKTADNTQNISEGIDAGSLDKNIAMMLDNLDRF